jgi:hypothetical protein
MLVATIAIFPPAVARLPFDFFAGALEVFGATDLALLACVAYDTAAHRRLHRRSCGAARSSWPRIRRASSSGTRASGRTSRAG